MAITIKARQGTQIGYKGTSAGSLGWINQAGASGKAALDMGSQITKTALQIQSAFDDEMDQSEIRQEVQDMTSGLSKMQRTWNDGRYDTDNLGNNEKGFWQKREESLWGPAWEELTVGKDPKAISEFGVLFNNLYNAAYENAGTFGRQQRWARLQAKDQTTYMDLLNTIKTSSSVQQKTEAYQNIENMYKEGLEGAVIHRDVKQWTEYTNEAKADLDFFSAYENALGGLGLEANPNNMEKGYTSAHYDQAIININNNQTIDEPNRKKLRQFFKDNLALRLKAESRQAKINQEVLEKQLSNRNLTGDLTIQDVEAVKDGLASGRLEYWTNELNGKGIYHWTPLYNSLKKLIQTGTVEKINDVTKDPQDVEEIIRAAASGTPEEGGIPADEVTKLIEAIYKKAKRSDLALALNDATDHAKRVFQGPIGILAKHMNSAGQLDLNAKMAAADDKITAFDRRLEIMLKEGEKAGKTWMSMLNHRSPDFIVDDLIDSINGTMPDEKNPVDPNYVTTVEKIEEDTSIWDNIKEWAGGDDARSDEAFDEDGETVITSGLNNVAIEVYGRKTHYPPGTDYDTAKAMTDSALAETLHGNPAKRLQFETNHPGYGQYPHGTETPDAWRARLKRIGLR